ncbi:hypothetical protein GCM10022226_08740 [Sphaerisporangium flaviroseum]|uniref:Uncharacterized protein n=1 Tax=Sphaerisporangium flaviroseum TaxID=509199 RepID=A0ABP7HDX8_9ACTN
MGGRVCDVDLHTGGCRDPEKIVEQVLVFGDHQGAVHGTASLSSGDHHPKTRTTFMDPSGILWITASRGPSSSCGVVPPLRGAGLAAYRCVRTAGMTLSRKALPEEKGGAGRVVGAPGKRGDPRRGGRAGVANRSGSGGVEPVPF